MNLLSAPYTSTATDSGAGAAIGLVVAVGLGVYFLPTLIAAIRHSNAGSVFILNLFLGWTFVGWVVSMSMAMSSRVEATVINVHSTPPQVISAYPQIQAGWYVDPQGTGQRYWDGTSWTAIVA